MMLRFLFASGLWLLGIVSAAMAESLAERGDYPVNAIMAYGNCRSPRDASGQMIKAQPKQADLADIIAYPRQVPRCNGDLLKSAGSNPYP
jgi:hypothetical protein